MRYGLPWDVERERYRLMADNDWKRWFAWYPVRLDNMAGGVWWEYVEYNQPMTYNFPRYRLPR